MQSGNTLIEGAAVAGQNAKKSEKQEWVRKRVWVSGKGWSADS